MENVKTVALSGAETRIEIGGSHCHIRNDSSNVIYAAKKPGLTAGEDGVLSVPVGGSAVLYGIAGEVYLTGAGNIQLVGSDYAESPFKSAPGAGGGSVTKAAVITALGYTPASLNAVGVVPAEELPSYIDDIVVKDTADDFPVTGESGVIYLALDTGINYRWTDAGYEEIPDIFGLAMGEYIGASGTIENTVEAPAFVTDFPINLFKPLNSNITRDGITLSYDKKTGKISVAGTPTSNYVQININYELNKKVAGTGDYVLSGGTSDVQIRLFTKTSGGLERAFISTGEPTACKITDEHTTTWLAITVTSGANIAPSHTELYPILVKGDRYRGFIPYGGGTIKTIGQNGEENELFLSPNTILPAAGLKTFDGVTNVISDFEVSLAYYKNKQQPVPIEAMSNEIKNRDLQEYTGISGTINNTVDAPAFITDFPKNLLEITAESQAINGVTFTVDKKMGTITANGTAQDTVILYINKEFTVEEDDVYFLRGYNGIPEEGELRLLPAYQNPVAADSSGIGKAVALSKDVIYRCCLVLWTGFTFDNRIFRPIVIKGSVSRGFIPYGGGAIKTIGKNGEESEIFLSPNTKTPVFGLKTFDGATNVVSDFEISLAYYKQEIQSVPIETINNKINDMGLEIYTGFSGIIYNTVEAPIFITDFNGDGGIVKTVGKNLFNGSFALESALSDVGVYYYEVYSCSFEDFFKVSPGSDYRFQVKNYPRITVFYYESNTNESFISFSEWKSNNFNRTFTTPANCNYIKVMLSKTDIHEQSDYPIDFMIEKGRNTTKYEPYKFSEIYLSKTKIPTIGLKTFDGVTNVISDFEVSLAYYKNKQQSVPIKAVENDFVQKPKANTFEINPIFPTNIIRYDNIGEPSVMVRIPKFKLSDVIDGASDTVHPAFIVNGTEIPWIEISKYQNTVETGRAYSRAGADPKTDINFDSARSACEAKGAGWHLMTNAEWAAIALWCKKNGFMPYGNNDYGKDSRETMHKALPTSLDGTAIERVATGTGPVEWSHNNQLDGIYDLNGNVWEWIEDVRTVAGELQILSNGVWNAVDGTTGEFISPNGSGTTNNSIKLDFVSGHWEWIAGAITSGSSSSRLSDFENISVSDTICSKAKTWLYAMGLAPDDVSFNYDGNCFWAITNALNSRLIRGGGNSNGSKSGLFTLNLNNTGEGKGAIIGFRSAYYEP